MSSGQILHGSHNGVEVLYYRGDIRHTLCVALDQYIQHLLENPDLKGFVCDLTGAQSIDSTNLGILARLARAMQREGLPRVTLISNQPDIDELLEAVGFGQVFNIVASNESGGEPVSEILQSGGIGGEQGALMLQAHRALMELNAENRTRFRDVVKAFEKEIQS